MIRWLILFAMLLPVLNSEYVWSYDFVAGAMIALSCMFYILCFQLLVGMKHSILNLDIDMSDMWISRMIQISATIILHKAGYTATVYFILPWILINTVVDVISTLVVLKVLGMSKVEDKGED